MLLLVLLCLDMHCMFFYPPSSHILSLLLLVTPTGPTREAARKALVVALKGVDVRGEVSNTLQ